MYSNEEMLHSGILGMKWHLRRFQNEDGTLTPAGRERYRKERAEAKEAKKQAKAEAKEIKLKEKQHNEITKQSISKKQIGQMSDDELNARITRLKKEKEYLDLSDNVTNKSKNVVKSILSKAGQTAATSIATDVLTYAGKRAIKQFVSDQTYDEMFKKKKG